MLESRYMDDGLKQLTKNLSRLATHYDVEGVWPDQSIQHLTDAGAWTWVIPEQYGGMQLDPMLQVRAYEAVAAGCMACLLILTQRDGAVEFIIGSERDDLKDKWLPLLCRHKVMTSVGISQLTTSKRRGKAAMQAESVDDGYVLNGFMPWVTGAHQCDFIVTGAMLPDGQQVLAMVPTDAKGVVLDRPMNLMALEASQTCEVRCRSVRLGKEHILRDASSNALQRRTPVKSLVVSSAGLGLAGALANKIQRHSRESGGHLADLADDALSRYTAIRERIFKTAARLDKGNGDEIPKAEIRVSVNELLMRLAMTCLTFAKGSGFIRQRDAQRLAREAMFFLVWSATDEVRAKTLARFLDAPEMPSKSLPN